METFDIIDLPSPNGQLSTPLHPRYVVAHCIGLSLEDTLYGLTHKASRNDPRGLGVSAHYIIPQICGSLLQKEGFIPSSYILAYPEKVPVFRLIPENRVAWHAGLSSWQGQTNLNTLSIGIEFHSPGYGEGGNLFKFGSYSPGQLNTGLQLVQAIIKRWKMNPQNFIGHSDIACYRESSSFPPTFKTDPGPLFPWDIFLVQGIGQPPRLSQELPLPYKTSFFRKYLYDLGYPITPTGETWGEREKHILQAYTLRFLPQYWKKGADGAYYFELD